MRDRITPAYRLYVLVLLGTYAVLWLWLAVAPLDRRDWALENMLVAAFGFGLWASHRAFVFSRVSYTLIFVFLCLHAVGAHYTYAQVPYEAAWRALTGDSFNALVGWQRNNYDRVVHFSYGLLLAYPIREIFLRVADVRGFWGYFLPLDFTLSTSALFELIEWGAASVVGGDLGAAYLGTQGDIWDAQKDMALAATGALTAMLITAVVNGFLQRDFAREWSNSLKVKDARPYGENEIARMLDDTAGQAPGSA
ncbi:DUF2238 domain-containing protein [Fontimonas sp. SYSU GA230001]|uniref:DUF2238 domain-containing protein n=1 Tax=Fontimonas sp. SYSU GA230001 TaxID=3142450 RepID=UPI0032B3597A